MSKIIKTEDGYKLDWEGESFQDKIRSSEYKSALIVFEKYKRQFNLKHDDLINLKDWIIDKVKERETIGKKTSKDFMIQLCSEEIKFHKNLMGI